uniref:Aldehyde dehydrogenase domain-containing protein n=1 Tax=Spongospora subterranea TaxID=70186 RepID=A0A0H5R7P8_9EUKA|eukprot:CRZ09846.1 hypothetical protein [Spongospora subterranea]
MISMHRSIKKLDVPRLLRCFSNKVLVDNPYTGEIFTEVVEIDEPAMLQLVDRSCTAFKSWKESSLPDRIALCRQFISSFESKGQVYAEQISQQMGKPISQSIGEIRTTISRANAMILLAENALADVELSDVNGIQRRISREPIGPVLLLCPWNYPMLCAINGIIPAILSGNSVLVKQAERSSLCADALEESFAAANAPKGLLQAFHGSHDRVAHAIAHPGIAYVNFTGSVQGGQSVYKTVSDRFIDVGLELGGKDAAYICADADVASAAAGVIDGAFYNSGQSCCAVERIYVHEAVYDSFIEHALPLVKDYKLGDPMQTSTSLGPMAQKNAASFLSQQIKQAESLGARILTGGKPCNDQAGKGRFFAPTLAVNCTHEMSLMVEESFGPVVGVMSVKSDDEAIKLMNDSPYGLTASIWTKNDIRADSLGPLLNVGTIYQNRCDYLDPELPWSGRKASGKGLSLSHLAYQSFTKTKSYNLRRWTT